MAKSKPVALSEVADKLRPFSDESGPKEGEIGLPVKTTPPPGGRVGPFALSSPSDLDQRIFEAYLAGRKAGKAERRRSGKLSSPDVTPPSLLTSTLPPGSELKTYVDQRIDALRREVRRNRLQQTRLFQVEDPNVADEHAPVSPPPEVSTIEFPHEPEVQPEEPEEQVQPVSSPDVNWPCVLWTPSFHQMSQLLEVCAAFKQIRPPPSKPEPPVLVTEVGPQEEIGPIPFVRREINFSLIASQIRRHNAELFARSARVQKARAISLTIPRELSFLPPGRIRIGTPYFEIKEQERAGIDKPEQTV